MIMAIAFKPGDLVSRDGTDVQRVLEINDAGDLMLVECIKEPLGSLNDDGTRGEPWLRLGEQEWNLTRRYEFAGEIVEGQTNNFIESKP